MTDVLDLHNWMVKHLDEHPLFKRLTDEDLKDDPCIPCVMKDTEEGIKVIILSSQVARNNGSKYLACYVRIAQPKETWNGFEPFVSGEGKNVADGTAGAAEKDDDEDED